VILTCEKLVDVGVLRAEPENNQIPGIIVDAVVPVAHGAYPTACYRYYDYDPVYLNAYRNHALDDQAYSEYLKEWIFGLPDHQALLEKTGADRLAAIKADPRTGYAVGLDRR
jgi:glutaconate CoA-transferase subunit A